MSVGDQDLYVMMNVNGVAGSTKEPGISSRLPILVTLDDLNPGQSHVTTILAFISGASFVSLVIIMILFLFCRNRRSRDDDDISNSSIVYNIEQDSVNMNPALEKHIQDILLHDDITGLLDPSLKALKAAHAVTAEMSAAGQLVLTNMRHLHLVRRSITQLPLLCDMAIQALITTEVNPMEVEARMVALGIGLENLVGLLQIWEGNENMNIISHMTNFEKQLDLIKKKTDKWNQSRHTIVNIA